MHDHLPLLVASLVTVCVGLVGVWVSLTFVGGGDRTDGR